MKGGDIIKAPCRSIWESVHEGFELEIHVVDHCNLKCAGCNHFAPLADPYFIDRDHFNNQLKMVKEKLPSIQRLILLGGEPCLHPDLSLLCADARSIFPTIDIQVLTNGSLLDSIIKDSDIYLRDRIFFSISKYIDIDYDEKKIEQIKNLGIGND